MSPIAAAGGAGDLRASLLPPELLSLFDDRFVASCDRIEQYVFRLALRVVRESGLEVELAAGGTLAALAARAGLDPRVGPALAGWLLRLLAERGAVTVDDGPDARFAAPRGLPALEPGELEREQEREDPASLPSFRLAALAADAYPAVLRGEIDGESVLFAADHLAAWSAYFSNSNPLYAISNTIGAAAALARFPHPSGAALEVGGGLGSGAAALLARFAAAGALERITAYRFTERSPLFLRRGQRALGALAAAAGRVASGRLDIDRPFAEAGIAPGSVSLVYGVNTLHIARDLAFTLAEIRTALRPGGLVLASECVRPFAGRTVHVEFVFRLLEAFRGPPAADPARLQRGFLTPEEWTAAFRAGGFDDAFVWPDVARIRDHYPSFVVAAVGATRP